MVLVQVRFVAREKPRPMAPSPWLPTKSGEVSLLLLISRKSIPPNVRSVKPGSGRSSAKAVAMTFHLFVSFQLVVCHSIGLTLEPVQLPSAAEAQLPSSL